MILTSVIIKFETNISKAYLKKDGSTLLTGNLNNYKMTNLQKLELEQDPRQHGIYLF